LILSIISCAGFYLVTTVLIEQMVQSGSLSKSPDDSLFPISKLSLKSRFNRAQLSSALLYFAQLCQMPNFIAFILMSLIQVFHCHFNSSFMPLFLQLLLQNHFPPYFCPMVMGLSFLLPHLNNFYFLQLCEKKGTYHVIRSLLVVKFAMGLGVLLSDVNVLWVIAAFIASNRIFTEGICRLCDLVVADLIDQDYVENDRQVPIMTPFFRLSVFL